MTDEEIERRIRQGDISVFDYIMDRYNKLLWAVIGNILERVGAAEDIEDCISDVYVKLLEYPKIYSHQNACRTTAYKAGLNVDRIHAVNEKQCR